MVEVMVCIGSACHLKGAYNVLTTFQQMTEEAGLHDKIDLKATFCIKQCQKAVCVTVDGEVCSVTPEGAREFFRRNIADRLC